MSEWIDKTVAMLNKIEGLPAVALVFGFCLIVGYIIRSVKRIDNSSIPVIVTAAGSLFMGLLANSRATDQSLRVWIVRNIVVGGIIGGATVVIHRFGLKYLEDWVRKKFNITNTTFFNKEKPEPPEE